jgi:hypothetical protein
LVDEQDVVEAAILRLAYAPEDASRRMKVLKLQLMGKRGVAVRPVGTEKSVKVVRRAAPMVVGEAPCDANGATAKQPSCV